MANPNKYNLYNECMNDNWVVVIQILDHDVNHDLDLEATPCENETTPLLIACLRNKANVVKKLLECGAEIEGSDRWNQTALMYAKNINIAKILTGEGANIEARDNTGWTSLIGACVSDDLKMVKYLLDRGANIDTVDDRCYTALMYAAVDGNIIIIKELLDRGADRHLVDEDGETFLDHFRDEKLKNEIEKYIGFDVKPAKTSS